MYYRGNIVDIFKKSPEVFCWSTASTLFEVMPRRLNAVRNQFSKEIKPFCLGHGLGQILEAQHLVEASEIFEEFEREKKQVLEFATIGGLELDPTDGQNIFAVLSALEEIGQQAFYRHLEYQKYLVNQFSEVLTFKNLPGYLDQLTEAAEEASKDVS